MDTSHIRTKRTHIGHLEFQATNEIRAYSLCSALKKTLILSQRVFQHLSRTVATDETVEVKLAFAL